MENSKIIKITREELYNLVWSKPLIKLSEQFGLSDVGLSKTCKRNNIPTPPVGYWAKLANGHVTLQTPLPTLSKDDSDVIEFQLDSRKEEEIVKREKYSYVYEEFGVIKKEGIELKVIRSLDTLHPLLKDSYKKKSNVSPSIYVSDDLRERAYRFSHTLFYFLEAQGFKIEIHKDDRSTGTVVNIKNTKVEIIVTEKSKRIESTKPKSPTSFYDSKYEFVPSGLITFKAGKLYLFQKEWSDSKTGMLEDKIYDIVEGILSIAIKDRIHTLEHEEWQRQCKEKERSEAERKERSHQHEMAIDRLLTNATKWKQSNLIKEYVSAVKLKAEQSGIISDQLSQWVTWAMNEADTMITLEPYLSTDIRGNSKIEEFTNPKYHSI
jgi:hypothetical protein